MHPKFVSTQQLLEDYLFEIPKYQRPYSWTERELNDLHSDILKIIEKDEDHFMATLVAVSLEPLHNNGKPFKRLEVVDGQQRLTSLAILLRAISNELLEVDEYYNKINDLLVNRDNEALLIINTNYDKNSILEKFLREGKTKRKDFIPTTITEKRLLNAIDLSIKFVKEFEKTEERIKLFNIIANKLKFLLHVLENNKSVYTTFEVLNSRGKPVGTIDKCKSILLGRVAQMDNSDEKIKDLHKKWVLIFEKIGVSKINTDEVVRMAVTILDKTHTRKIKNSDDSIEFFKKTEADFSKILDWHDTLIDIVSHLSELENTKKLRAIFQIIQVKFLFLAIILRAKKDTNFKESELILKQLENVSFRIYGFGGLDSRNMKGEFFELAQRVIEETNEGDELISSTELKKEIKKLGEGYEIEKVVDKIKNKDLYDSTNWREEIRYFFYKYEEFLCQKKSIKIKNQLWESIWNDTAESSIEHIIPQKYDKKDWGKSTDNFENDPKLKKITINRLGNFILLPPSINSKAKNKSFKDKKDIYQNGSSLLLVEKFLKECGHVWNRNKIVQREKKLLEYAKEIWKDVY